MIPEFCKVSYLKYCIELAVYEVILTHFQSLRLRWCIIVGCEGEYSKPRAEPERSRGREAERVADGPREAVHSRIKEERRTHGRVRSLNFFGKLFSYSCLLSNLVASTFCTLLLLLKPLITIITMCVRIKPSKPCFETPEFYIDSDLKRQRKRELSSVFFTSLVAD